MAEGTKARVLVVDDDMNLRKVICLFLQNSQYETYEAKNGKEAITMVGELFPDAIVMDVMMPVMDGFEACRYLKTDPATKEIPIVMCTARSRKEDLVSAIRSGVEDYIVKPFTKETLIGKIEKVLSEKTRKSTTVIKAVERRKSGRISVSWALSWGNQESGNVTPIYKSKILNISAKGFAFDFNRCEVCTGYDQGSVHPLCLLAPYAIKFEKTQMVDFILSIKQDVVIECQGKIAHIFQPVSAPKIERVGIEFTKISEENKDIIRRYVTGPAPSAH